MKRVTLKPNDVLIIINTSGQEQEFQIPEKMELQKKVHHFEDEPVLRHDDEPAENLEELRIRALAAESIA